MPVFIDPQLRHGLEQRIAASRETPRAAPHDVEARRRNSRRRFEALGPPFPSLDDAVESRRLQIGEDAERIPVTVMRSASASAPPKAVIVYLHGGGMIRSDLDNYMGLVQRYAVELPEALFVVPEYRLAPEHDAETLLSDCARAVRWAWGRRRRWAAEDVPIGLIGSSAGGGLAAGLCQLLADEGDVELAFQLLIAPMLDPRGGPAHEGVAEVATWTSEDNATGWAAALGDPQRDARYVPAARRADLAGLPPAHVEVGDVDIFCPEDVSYAQALIRAGVPTQLIVRPGVLHGFEALAPRSELLERVVRERVGFVRWALSLT